MVHLTICMFIKMCLMRRRIDDIVRYNFSRSKRKLLLKDFYKSLFNVVNISFAFIAACTIFGFFVENLDILNINRKIIHILVQMSIKPPLCD